MVWGEIFLIPTTLVRKVRLRKPKRSAKTTGLGSPLQSQDPNPSSDALNNLQVATFAWGLYKAKKAPKVHALGLK